MKSELLIYRHLTHITALEKVIQEYYDTPSKEFAPSTIKKIVLYGVKIANSHNSYSTLNPIEINSQISFYESIQSIIAMLTPNEFMNIFPIKKEYYPTSLKLKDYFHTKRYLSSLDMDKPIGEEIIEFLFNYHNDEVYEFITRSLYTLSKQVDIIVAFSDSNNKSTSQLISS